MISANRGELESANGIADATTFVNDDVASEKGDGSDGGSDRLFPGDGGVLRFVYVTEMTSTLSDDKESGDQRNGQDGDLHTVPNELLPSS